MKTALFSDEEQYNDNCGNRKFYDRLAGRLFVACAVIVALLFVSIFLFIGWQGGKTFYEVGPGEFFLSEQWSPSDNKYGALGFIGGSLFVAGLAVLFAAPVGIAGALFLAEVAPRPLRGLLRPVVALSAATPSVVYGLVGLTVIVPFAREFFDAPGGCFGLFAAALTVGIMLLPTIIIISGEAINAVPSGLAEASLSLGATYWQTIWHVILPAARPGILAATAVSLARAVGETVAVQMVIGHSPAIVRSLFGPATTLTGAILRDMGEAPTDSAWGNALCLMAFILLLLSALTMVAARRVAVGKRV